MTQYIIVTGNIRDGLRFIGPFDDEQCALDYGDDAIDTEWVLVDLENMED